MFVEIKIKNNVTATSNIYNIILSESFVLDLEEYILLQLKTEKKIDKIIGSFESINRPQNDPKFKIFH